MKQRKMSQVSNETSEESSEDEDFEKEAESSEEESKDEESEEDIDSSDDPSNDGKVSKARSGRNKVSYILNQIFYIHPLNIILHLSII